MKAAAIRTPRKIEAFEVKCHACAETVEIGCDVVYDGWALCPNCGRALLIRWAEMRRTA